MTKKIDLTGQRFGRWTVLKYDENKKGGTAYWICKCDCGTERSVCGSSLRNGASTSCGCFKIENSRKNNGKFIDEIGNRYGKLTVIAYDEELSIKKHRAQWVCQCDCGNIITTSSKCLRENHTISCGCQKRSLGEENIVKILEENKIKYLEEYNIIIDENRYRFDFAILNEKNEIIRLIEFDGIQHFDAVRKHWGDTIDNTKRRDNIKNNYALSNGIPLVRIPYWERDNITLELLMGNKYLITNSAGEI